MVQLQNNDFDFRSQIAQLSSTKRSCAHICSGATHHLFHSRKSFINYSRISQVVMAASGVSRPVVEGEVPIPLDGDMFIKAYHAPHLSYNILSVGLLIYNYIVAFTDDTRRNNACLVMDDGPWKILGETEKKNGLYILRMKSLELNMTVTTVAMNVN